MSSSEHSDEEIKEMSKKELRKEFPSGWMEISRYETLVLAIDALLESPASRQFAIEELADLSGASERSLGNHIDSLVELGIIKEISAANTETVYTLNSDSPIVQKLYELNSTVERVKNGNAPKTTRDGLITDEKNLNSANQRNTKPSRDFGSTGLISDPLDDNSHTITS